MALTKEILNSHPISTLKKEISKTNIKGYSKMKKDEIVELMMKNKERFGHIRMKGESSEKPKGKGPAEKPKKKVVEKIDYDKVEESNSFLSGNDFIFELEDFMTDSEQNAQSESAQNRALERASVRVSKFIMKALKKIAKKEKIKSTDEFIKFLNKIKSSSKMRELIEDA